ncbi:MAG: hypothetical protein EOO15_15200, partial [Chitinophagaceae bacterium]
MSQKLPVDFAKVATQLHLKANVLLTMFLLLMSQFMTGQGAACVNAINLTVNGASVTGTISDTNVTPAATSCVVSLTSDGWYKFTATSTTAYVTVAAASRNLILYGYASCGGTQITCANNVTSNGAQTESMTMTGLSVGSVYFVRVANSAANANMPLTSVQVSTTPVYCMPSFDTAVEAITNVTFGGINNSNAGTVENQDFTSIVGTVVQGSTTNPISVSGNTEGNFTNYIRVYVDWNHDGVFNEAADERYNIGTIVNCQGCAVTGNISVPANALLGNTRMRVVKNYNAYSTACGSTSYGQSEDYTVNVITPPPTITDFTPSTLCQGADAAGRTVVITGSLFTGTSSVQFNGVNAQAYTVDSDTQITAIAPASVATGNITVTATTGTTVSGSTLTVNPSPTVAAITNNNGPLCVGDSADLNDPTPAGNWNSLNPQVATVDNNGIVTAVSGGTATITYSITNLGCTTTVSTVVTVNEPIVSSNPSAQTIITGSTATYSVTATGSVVSYQWMVSTDGGDNFTYLGNDSNYSGVNTNTLTISNTPAEFNENQYMVVITPMAPCEPFESSAAPLNVGDTGIVTDPANVSLCSTGSGIADFTVVASGTIGSYSWEEDQGLGFMPLTNGTFSGVTYSGTSTDHLTISGLTTANTGWAYKAIATGPANSAPSNAAILTVNQGVQITGQPAAQIACATGSTSSFSVTATGDVTSYQWQYSPDGVTYADITDGVPAGISYSGATTSQLTVDSAATTPLGTYYYHVIANGAGACAAVTSNAATLSVTQPTISVTPSSASYCNPGAAVSLTASGAVSYSWSPAAGLSATTGSTVLASPSANTTYTVTGTDANGCTNTQTVTISVGNGVTANATASATEVCAGAPVQLSAGGLQEFTTGPASSYSFAATSRPYAQNSASATELTSVEADDTISASQNIGFTFNYSGSTFNTFAMSSNGYISLGASPSNNATNNLQPAMAGNRPIIAPLWDDLDGRATEGSVASYEVTGTAPNRVLTVEWRNWEWDYSSTAAVISFQAKLYETSGVIEFCYRSEAGAYTASFTGGATIGINTPTGNGAGTYLSVSNIGAPVAASSPSTNNLSTKPATGTVYRFTPGNAPTFTYSWTSTPAGFTSTSANPTATPSATTTYNVVVTSPSGCSGSASVTVNTASGAAITTQPAAATVCEGSPVSFSVVATGPGLTYQWRRNGQPITGNATATTATLSAAAVVPAVSGNYDVVVTPGCGSPVTSNAVALLVNPTPTATAPTNQNFCIGSATTPIAIVGTPAGVTFDVTGGSSIGLANQTGVTAIPSFTPALGTATITLTPKANGCTGTPVTFTITINPLPSAVTVTPSAPSICANGAPVLLTSSGGVVTTSYCTPVIVGNPGATGDYLKNFTFANIVNNGTNDAASDYTYYSGLTANVVANGTTTYNVSLTAGGTSTTFAQQFRIWIDFDQNGTFEASESVFATSTATYSPTSATGTVTIPHTALNGITRMRVASRYSTVIAAGESCQTPSGSYGEFEDYNVNITGGTPANIVWSPTAGLYTDAAGTTAYTGTQTATVYAKPSSTTTYSVTATSVAGCSSTGTATVTVVSLPTIGSVSQAATVCPGATATINVGGLVAGSTSTFTYTIGGGAPQTAAGVVANASGSATFVVTLSGANNGQSLVITSIQRTDNAPSCSVSPTANNSTILSVFGTYPFYADVDGDGFGAGSAVSLCAVDAATPPAGYSLNDTDCNDSDANSYQSTTLYVDGDNDGYTNGDTATVCYGAAIPQGYVASLTAIDCNDAVAAINPGHAEVLYNGVDDNCDGQLDEGFQFTSNVQPAQCGTTLASIGSLISAVSLPQVNGYRWEVTNTETNVVQTFETG